MKKKIAFFDFDGTITTHDTLAEFIKYSRGSLNYYAGLMVNGFTMAGYLAGIIANQPAKEKLLTHFFKGMEETIYREGGRAFCEEKLPPLIRPGALAEIEKLKAEHFEIVIVSASAEGWLQPWCDSFGLRLIATKLVINKGRLTGKIDGKNCYGEEKVARIKQQYQLDQYETIYAYGDTSGDKPMLELSTHAFYKPFR